MKYHLDATVFVDWERESPTLATLRDEILRGMHELSIDPISEVEFLASRRSDARLRLAFAAIGALSRRIEITREASELAASWLGPMDRQQRRARFADAIVSAVSHLAGATLLTSDTGIASSFPIAVREY